jgi:hypothetical protein
MFTTRKIQAVTFVALALAALILIAATTFGRASLGTNRADDAYSQRLTQLALHIQQEQARAAQARAAWSARLNAQAQAFREEAARAEKANKAWSDRLTGQANQSAGMSDKANAAWTARLNGLAEAYAASK